MTFDIALINPNTTASMTAAMLATARALAPELALVGHTATRGVPAIDGHGDDVHGALAVMDVIAADPAAARVWIVACFGDPGLHAARELTDAPVIGIAEASMAAALAVSRRFSILTTTPRNATKLRDLVHARGLDARCASVRPASVGVLEAHHDPRAAAEALLNAGARAILEDGAGALCLGCGGMVDLAAWLQERLEVPVIEAVPAAVALARTLVHPSPSPGGTP